MDLLSWVWWLIKIPLTLIWFLIGGWVSTLQQVAVLVLAVFTWKHGWKRAPAEAWGAAQTLWGWGKAWLLAARGAPAAASGEPRVVTRVRVKEVRVRDRRPGDINISTLMSLMAMAGVAAMVLL